MWIPSQIGDILVWRIFGIQRTFRERECEAEREKKKGSSIQWIKSTPYKMFDVWFQINGVCEQLAVLLNVAVVKSVFQPPYLAFAGSTARLKLWADTKTFESIFQ